MQLKKKPERVIKMHWVQKDPSSFFFCRVGLKYANHVDGPN